MVIIYEGTPIVGIIKDHTARAICFRACDSDIWLQRQSLRRDDHDDCTVYQYNYKNYTLARMAYKIRYSYIGHFDNRWYWVDLNGKVWSYNEPDLPFKEENLRCES